MGDNFFMDFSFFTQRFFLKKSMKFPMPRGMRNFVQGQKGRKFIFGVDTASFAEC